MRRTLAIYIISEILPPFLLGVLAFTFILVIARILKLIELVVTRGVPLTQIGKLFAMILPTFLEMTVPMALLLGIFLGLGRLSKDREILALKASGISPGQILLPVGLMGLLISLITLLLATWVRPQSNLALKKELYEIAKTRITTALKEKVFNDDFPKVLLYVDEVLPPGNMTQGLLVVDRRNPAREMIIFGKVALILFDEESKTLSLRIIDGAVYERDKKRLGFSQTRFNTYDLKLDPDETFAMAPKKERAPKEMSLRRLTRTIQLKEEQGLKPTPELIELHQRFSFSFAPLVFSLLALSAVMMPTGSHINRSWGLALCLMWLLLYYGFLSIGKALAEKEFLAPALGLWLPNIVMGLIAIHLFRKALKDSPLWIPTKLETLSLFLLRKLAHHHGRN